MDTNMRTRNER